MIETGVVNAFMYVEYSLFALMFHSTANKTINIYIYGMNGAVEKPSTISVQTPIMAHTICWTMVRYLMNVVKMNYKLSSCFATAIITPSVLRYSRFVFLWHSPHVIVCQEKLLLCVHHRFSDYSESAHASQCINIVCGWKRWSDINKHAQLRI